MEETSNKWLWIGIGAVVCIVILLFASPLGTTIKGNINSLTTNVNSKITEELAKTPGGA